MSGTTGAGRATRRRCSTTGAGNIIWRGPLDAHLVNIIKKEYHRYASPPNGMSKKLIAALWGKTLGIASKDPSGERVQQNMDKITSAWKAVNCLRNSTGFVISSETTYIIVACNEQRL